jgi:sulfate adenylyltransferase subunit 1
MLPNNFYPETPVFPDLNHLEENDSELNHCPEITLLRIFTAGGVGSGKSSLVKRLLSDSKSIIDKQFLSPEDAGKLFVKSEINFSSLAEGFEDKSGQGFNAELTYSYFTTKWKEFIVADIPGHIDFTRNVITTASASDIVLLIIDSQCGISEQTKRYLYLASLLQVKHVILVINKMDLVAFSEDAFNSIKREFELITANLNLSSISFIPTSVIDGINVVEESEKTSWYHGDPLLQLLENIRIYKYDYKLPARFAVQYVVDQSNDNLSHNPVIAGYLSSGTFRVGNRVLVLPSNKSSTIKGIKYGRSELTEAISPQSVTLRLADKVEIKRGDLIVNLFEEFPRFSSTVSFFLCWFNNRPLNIGDRFIVLQTTDKTIAVVTEVVFKIDFASFEKNNNDKTLNMNELARVTIKMAKPLKYDAYNNNHVTGSLILIDEHTSEIAGAGMIVADEEVYSYNI